MPENVFQKRNTRRYPFEVLLAIVPIKSVTCVLGMLYAMRRLSRGLNGLNGCKPQE